MRVVCWLVGLAGLLAINVTAQTVLMKSPIVFQAPQYQRMMNAWYDGDAFWIDPAEVFVALGYEVVSNDSVQTVARDARQSLSIHYGQGTASVNQKVVVGGGVMTHEGDGGQHLIQMSLLQSMFADDIDWDPNTLSLKISTQAALFNPGDISTRRSLSFDTPDNIMFGRSRALFGGLLLEWELQQSIINGHHRIRPRGGYAVNVASATLEGDLVPETASSRIIIPIDRPWLRWVEASQRTAGHWEQTELRISNTPLAHPRVYEERTLDGSTAPHALIEARVAGELVDRFQADGRGRYALRAPLLYGSSETVITATPLGGYPEVARRVFTLIPRYAVPKGRFYYSVSASRGGGEASASVGVTSRITMRGGAGYGQSRRTVGATYLVTDGMSIDADVDLKQESLDVRYDWWTPHAGVLVNYTDGLDPSAESRLTASAHAKLGQFGLYSTLSQRSRTGANATVHGGWQSKGGVRASVRASYSDLREARWNFTPQVDYSFRSVGGYMHLSAGAITHLGAIRQYNGSLNYHRSKWNLRLQAGKETGGGPVSLGASAYIELPWAQFSSSSSSNQRGVQHRSRLRGTLSVSDGLRFSHRLQGQTEVVFRPFQDHDMDGVQGEGEAPYHSVVIESYWGEITKSSGGEIRFTNLNPHQVYTAWIPPASIRNPLLHPSIGYRFSFIAEPGRTRVIPIPIQSLPRIAGQLHEWDGAYPVLEVVFTHLPSGAETTMDVYRGGEFYGQVRQGESLVRITNQLTNKTVWEGVHAIQPGQNWVNIHINQTNNRQYP